jgi:hypothetical protein
MLGQDHLDQPPALPRLRDDADAGLGLSQAPKTNVTVMSESFLEEWPGKPQQCPNPAAGEHGRALRQPRPAWTVSATASLTRLIIVVSSIPRSITGHAYRRGQGGAVKR